MSEEIPDDIVRFILTSIPSVSYIEAILLFNAEPDRAWSLGQVARRLYISEAVARTLLAHMEAANLLEVSGSLEESFRYHPKDLDLGKMLDKVADTYRRNLVAVSTLIHSKSGKRAHVFADAFKWRKDV